MAEEAGPKLPWQEDKGKDDFNLPDKIQQLVDETGCTTRQARLILKTTFGNFERAKDIINSLAEENIYILKGSFIADKKLWGYLIIAFNLKLDQLEWIECATTYTNASLDVNDSWQIFSEDLQQVKNEGTLEITKKLKVKLEHSFRLKPPSFSQEELELTKERLLDEIFDILNCSELELEVASDEVNFLDYDKTSDKDEMGLRLKTSLFLAPMSGHPVDDLEEGDQVMVKIIDNREIGKYLAKLLGTNLQDGKSPFIPASIKEIKRIQDPDSYRIISELGPGIYGESWVLPATKVKLANPEFFQQDKEQKEQVKTEKKDLLKEFKIKIVIAIILFIVLLLIISTLG